MAFLGRLYHCTTKSDFFSFRKDFPRRVNSVVVRSLYSSGLRLVRKQHSMFYDPSRTYNDPYFPKNYTAVKLVGCVPNYVGYYPSQAITPNIKFISWLRQSKYLHDDFLLENHFRVNRVHLTAGFDTMLPILKEYAKPTTSNLTVDDYLRVLSEEGFPWLQLPKMKFPSDSSALGKVLIKKDSDSGFYTSMFFGKTKSGSALPTLRAAEHIFNTLKTKEFPYQGLWALYGRSKICKLEVDHTDPLSTRAVWVPEHVISMLGCLVVQEFTAELQMFSKNCVFIGKNFSSREMRWLNDLDDFADFKARCDWKHFDSDVSSEEILAALTIIQSCYGDDPHTIRYFHLMYRTLLDKNLVLPPGLVYKFSKGLPSGHPFTSLVGTLVNYMRWVMILQKLYGKGQVSAHSEAVFSGDDTLMWLKWHDNLFKLDSIIAETNKDWKSDSVVETLFPAKSTDYELQPHFLKRSAYEGGVIGWSTLSVLKSFSWPKESNFTLRAQINWFYNMVVTAPGNTFVNHILYEYLQWRIHEHYKGFKDRIYTEISIFESRFRRCMADGLKHQLYEPLINFLLPGWPYNLESHINTQGKMLVIDAARDWKTASSVCGSVTDIALLTLLGGKAIFKSHARRYHWSEAISKRKLFFSKYDAEVVSRLIGMRHEGSVISALNGCFGGYLPRWFPNEGVHSNFSFYIKYKLKKLFETHKFLKTDLRHFCRVTTRGRLSKRRMVAASLHPP